MGRGVAGALAALLSGCDPAPPPTDPAPPSAPTTPETPADDGPPLRRDRTIYATSEMMGTQISINVHLDPGRTRAEAGDAIRAAMHEISRIESLMSEWQPHSELSGLNDAAGGPPQRVGPELLEVLARAKHVSEATGGAFDVTFHGVGQLWSFQPGAEPPSPAAVEAHLPLVDWRKIELDREAGTARLAQPGMKIGLGAIAKGYAVDRASTVLRERGFENHVVEAGGDTFASGSKGGVLWRVGIQDPARPRALGALLTYNRSVVTSGDYQRFFEHEGKRFAHIIDPRTGWPVPEDRSLQSITLVADDATTADAFATAIAVMGFPRGMAFVESRPDLDAVLIDRDGTVHVSSGLGGLYVAAEAAPSGAVR